MNTSRRQLIGRVAKLTAIGGLFGGLVALFGIGSGKRHTARPRVDEKEEFSFRPPGALSEAEFLARCTHCYLCQDVCPVGCIQMKPDTESDRHTPYIIPRLKACTLCLKCGEVCPTGALLPVKEKADVRMGVAKVDEDICVSHLRSGAWGPVSRPARCGAKRSHKVCLTHQRSIPSFVPAADCAKKSASFLTGQSASIRNAARR